MSGWNHRDQYSALHVAIEDTIVGGKLGSTNAIAVSTSDTQTAPHDRRYPRRALVMALLLESWASGIHGGTIDLIASDEPSIRRVMRSHKGLFSMECRASASAIAQYERDLGKELSVILNGIRARSASLRNCLFEIADTFRAFGAFDLPDPPSPEFLARLIDKCFTYDNNIWQWKAGSLLTLVCSGSESLLFLQGTASDVMLELIMYVPRCRIDAHVRAAQTQFDAVVSEA
jgi:hypothetical protein